MRARNFKILPLAIATVMLLSSCGANNSKKGAQGYEGVKYPLKTDVVLKYWLPLNPNVAATATDLSQTAYAQEIEKRTGVKIEYIHPVAGQEKDQFNLILASGDLPDIVESGWYAFPGGPVKAINDGYITPLNDYIETEAPNLKKYLSQNADIDKMIKTDEGKYYCFPFIRGDDSLLIAGGPIIRKDWLDETGLGTPQTFEEWYNVLKTLKNSKKLDAPFTYVATQSYQITNLIGLFNASNGYYVDNGKIKYGPLEENFKEAVTTLAKWYSEGILDKNFASMDSKIQEANMMNGKSAMTVGAAGSQLGKWLNIIKGGNLPIKFAGLPYPTKNKGEASLFRGIAAKYPTNDCAAVSKKSKNINLAVKYLDYLYSDEGHMLANFGIDGVSYKTIDGYPKYTDEIMNNPLKLPVSQAMGKYLRASYAGPFVQDKRYIEQYYSLPEQKEAHKNWMIGMEEEKKYQLPKVLATSEESSKMAKITNDIDTYKDSMILKFITGNEKLENFDAFIQRIKAFGVDEAIGIQQKALERYNNR